jgi:RNA polymerase sigma factor (sigma-70 family)
LNSVAPDSSSSFAPTRWTLILRARGETPQARAALSERQGRQEDAARELTQEFFARVLAGSGFDAADPERGRFRSYLLGALKHFLADQRKHEHRLKRGGPMVTESLDATGPDGEQSSLQVADTNLPAPEAFFDREWALAMVGRAMTLLEKEFAEGGKTLQFDTLKHWLTGEPPSISQAEAAQKLGLSEGAVKVIIHRLRKRFRTAVRTEIVQTVHDPSLVDEELRHLITALS